MTMVLIVHSGYRMTSFNILMIGKQMQRTEGVLSQKKQRDLMFLTRETRTGLRLTGRCNENYTNIWDIMLGILFKIFPPGIGILCWKYFLLFFCRNWPLC